MGCAGGADGPVERPVRCAAAAAALLTALRTAFLAIDRRVVCGSSVEEVSELAGGAELAGAAEGDGAAELAGAGEGDGAVEGDGALGSRFVPAVAGSLTRGGGLVLPASPGREDPPGAW